MFKEEWRIIEEFPNYTISNTGKVKRIKSGKNTHIGKILKNVKVGHGYFIVSIYRDGKRFSNYIHRLVLETFIGKKDGYECNHIDGNKENNNLNNLEWILKKDNLDHAHQNKLIDNIGIHNGRSILNENKVIKIKQILKSNILPQEKIGKIFNISRSTISAIKTERLWSHVRI